jgi:hypothetical protein
MKLPALALSGAAMLLGTANDFDPKPWLEDLDQSRAAFAPLWSAPAAEIQAAATFRDCADCSLMKRIPAGRFRMGSPRDEAGRLENEASPRWMIIARPFALGAYDVTRAEYALFVEATGYAPTNPRCDWRRPTFRGAPLDQTPDEPVVCVSWSDANAYVRWLSARAGHAYRLPTETEWEYAARAGTTTARPAACQHRYCRGRRSLGCEEALALHFTGRLLSAKPLWPLRHAGQCLAMDRRLRDSRRRNRTTRALPVSRGGRRRLVPSAGYSALGGPCGG